MDISNSKPAQIILERNKHQRYRIAKVRSFLLMVLSTFFVLYFSYNSHVGIMGSIYLRLCMGTPRVKYSGYRGVFDFFGSLCYALLQG